MEICINGKKLDASLDKENTVGEVLAGLEQWLTDSGHRICELNIDGKIINASMIEDIFNREIKDIKNISINTNVVADLTAASLINLLEDINEYENLNFEEKAKYYNNWKETVTAQYISAEIPDLYSFCAGTFINADMSPSVLRSITEEIQREVNTPADEFKNLQPILNEICERLINLPLDIQTGKDALAARTIQTFSAVTEKIIRVFRQLDTQGYLTSVAGNEKPLSQLITEFGSVLKDLLFAYEKNDCVLVGDITEYEASPKLNELYNAILDNIKIKSALQGEK